MQTMRITVTQEDIDNGRRCDPDCCPVGRALSRAGLIHYGVIGSAVMIKDGQAHAMALPLPAPVRDWILDFDGSRAVEPFSFELPVPTAKRKPEAGRNEQTARRSAVLAAAR